MALDQDFAGTMNFIAQYALNKRILLKDDDIIGISEFAYVYPSDPNWAWAKRNEGRCRVGELPPPMQTLIHEFGKSGWITKYGQAFPLIGDLRETFFRLLDGHGESPDWQLADILAEGLLHVDVHSEDLGPAYNMGIPGTNTTFGTYARLLLGFMVVRHFYLHEDDDFAGTGLEAEKAHVYDWSINVPQLEPGEFLTGFVPASVEASARDDPALVRSVKRVIAFDEQFTELEDAANAAWLAQSLNTLVDGEPIVAPPRVVLRIVGDSDLHDFVLEYMRDPAAMLIGSLNHPA
jgi:hypothetical protein